MDSGAAYLAILKLPGCSACESFDRLARDNLVRLLPSVQMIPMDMVGGQFPQGYENLGKILPSHERQYPMFMMSRIPFHHVQSKQQLSIYPFNQKFTDAEAIAQWAKASIGIQEPAYGAAPSLSNGYNSSTFPGSSVQYAQSNLGSGAYAIGNTNYNYGTHSTYTQFPGSNFKSQNIFGKEY